MLRQGVSYGFGDALVAGASAGVDMQRVDCLRSHVRTRVIGNVARDEGGTWGIVMRYAMDLATIAELLGTVR